MLANVLAFLGALCNLFLEVVHTIVKSLVVLVLVLIVSTIGLCSILVALLR